MAKHQEVNIARILVIGAVAGFLLIVLVIGVQGWFLQEVHQETAAKWDDTPVRWLANLRAGQLEKINSYRWVDRQHQTVAIPIDEAMKLLLANGGRLPTTSPTTRPTTSPTTSTSD
ncbi:MAG TPA: hypothetical protein VIL86_18915 [Tepidisphaeraceae bacterium]